MLGLFEIGHFTQVLLYITFISIMSHKIGFKPMLGGMRVVALSIDSQTQFSRVCLFKYFSRVHFCPDYFGAFLGIPTAAALVLT